jgi:signal transduction histidine kinase
MFKLMFGKHFFLVSLVFVAMLALCGFLSHFLEKYERERFFHTQATDLLAQVEGHEGDKLAYVKELNEFNERMHSPLRLAILKEGEEAPPSSGPTFHQAIEINNEKMVFNVRLQFGRMGFRGRPPPPPGFRGGPDFGPHPVTFITMVIAILIASALSVVLIYRSFRDRAELAKEVFGRMQNGDLKARFPISKFDEASQVFTLFNQMADEIERLVSRLMDNEKLRVNLLQELAHDLRTPVASLKNVVETLKFDDKQLEQTSKEELREIAVLETEYLSQLVEDLLFLALVMEPKYKNESQEIQLAPFLKKQMEMGNVNYPKVKCTLEDLSLNQNLAVGNTHLLTRLFRNAYQNSCSFAKSEVTTTIHGDADKLTILIRDDGPGLSDEGLSMFGKKKLTRYGASTEGGRPSVGLGSVIIAAIATAHGGRASIRNVIENGKVAGAELCIELRVALRAVS